MNKILVCEHCGKAECSGIMYKTITYKPFDKRPLEMCESQTFIEGNHRYYTVVMEHGVAFDTEVEPLEKLK